MFMRVRAGDTSGQTMTNSGTGLTEGATTNPPTLSPSFSPFSSCRHATTGFHTAPGPPFSPFPPKVDPPVWEVGGHITCRPFPLSG